MEDMAGFLTLILEVEDMAGFLTLNMAGFLTLILEWKIWQVS